MNVLFVDADDIVAESVSSVLRRKGHICDTVGTGERAITLAQQHDYDIVVLEVSLPDMDAFDVMSRLKAEGIEIPVLLQSGQSNKSRAAKKARLEGEEVFAKPFIVTELIDRMAQIVAQPDTRDRERSNCAIMNCKFVTCRPAKERAATGQQTEKRGLKLVPGARQTRHAFRPRVSAGSYSSGG